MAIIESRKNKLLTKHVLNVHANSDKLFSLLVHNISEYAIFVIDTSGRILTWNEGAERIKGYSENEIIGKKIDIFYSAEDRQKEVPKKILYQAKMKGSFHAEGWRVRKNGEIFWADIVLTALYDPNGKLFGFAKLTRDNTERKLAEEKEEEDRKKFEALFYESSVCKIITEIDTGLIIEVNKSYCNFIGFKKEELIHKTIHELNIWVDIKQRDEVIKKVVLKKRAPKQWEIKIRVKNGSLKWILANFDVILHQRKLCFLTTFTDITAKKDLEEKGNLLNAEIQYRTSYQLKFTNNKYKSLINQAPDAIFMFNKYGYLLEVNTNTVKLTGYSKKELLKKNVRDFLRNTDSDYFQKIFTEFNQSKTSRLELIILNKKNEPIYIDFSCRKLSDDNFIAIAKNITENKKMTEVLKQSNEEYKLLATHLQTIREEERHLIAREIHDELGQYLTAISYDLSKLNDQIKDDQCHEKIVHAKLLLQDTINAVRKIAFNLRPIAIDELGLSEAIKFYAKDFENRTSIRCKYRDQTKGFIITNTNSAISFFRIFQEALTNVTRYAKASLVEVSLKIIDEKLLLTIKDNGVGFDLAEIAKKKSLGLIGMRERVKVINGDFTLNSKPGSGTTVIASTALANL